MPRSRGTLVIAASVLSSLIACSLALTQQSATTAELTPGPTFHHQSPRQLSFSAGDAFLACSDSMNNAEVFDLSTEESVWTWSYPDVLHTSVGDLPWPPPNRDPEMTLPDSYTGWPGDIIVKFPPHHLQRLAIVHNLSRYMDLLLMGRERTPRTMWEVPYWELGGYIHLYQGPQFENSGWLELRKPVAMRQDTRLVGLTAFTALEFSPVGPTIATRDTDGSLSLWSPVDNSYLDHVRPDPKPLYAVAFNPRGNLIATVGCSGIVRLWAVHRLQMLAKLFGHEVLAPERDWFWIQFSPDGSRFASYTNDGTLRVWDVEGACEEACITLPPEIAHGHFAFASGSDWVYAVGRPIGGGAGAFGRLDLSTGVFTKLQDIVDRNIVDMVCSPTHNLLAMADANGDEILTWHIRTPSPRGGGVVTPPTKNQGPPKTESP